MITTDKTGIDAAAILIAVFAMLFSFLRLTNVSEYFSQFSEIIISTGMMIFTVVSILVVAHIFFSDYI